MWQSRRDTTDDDDEERTVDEPRAILATPVNQDLGEYIERSWYEVFSQLSGQTWILQRQTGDSADTLA